MSFLFNNPTTTEVAAKLRVEFFSLIKIFSPKTPNKYPITLKKKKPICQPKNPKIVQKYKIK